MLYGEMRGEPEHRNRMRQIVNFQGMRFNNITPTDMDGFIEYHNSCYLIMEFKLSDKDVPYGQNIALIRLCNDLEKSGKPAIFMVCSHNITNWQDDIIAKDCIVRTMYFRKKLYKVQGQYTTMQMCDRFIRKYGK